VIPKRPAGVLTSLPMRRMILLAQLVLAGAALCAQSPACYNQCVDHVCSGYPTDSRVKSDCINRCIMSSLCQNASVNPWGAIAYSKPDEISGWAYEQESRATAERLAVSYCVKQGGKSCRVITAFSRACASVAADGDVVGSATGANRGAAEQRALSECARSGGKRCSIQAWTCSAPNSAGSASSGAERSAPPRPPKAVAWGAIAYSPGDYGAGWSQGKDNREAAEKEAMSACSQRGKGCVLRSSFNKQCGALAADGSAVGVATSADQRQALEKAMDECRKAGGARCAPHIAFCSF